jgi:hypothetical protein
MKKLLLLLLVLVAFGSVATAQSNVFRAYYKQYYDTVNFASVSGSDTTILIANTPYRCDIAIEYDTVTMTGTGAVLELQATSLKNTFALKDVTANDMPHTVVATGWIGVYEFWEFPVVAIKITKGSVTAGTMRILLTVKEEPRGK